MSLNWYGGKSATLTNLQYISDSSLVEKPHALAKWGVLILKSIRSASTWGAVHTDVSFISRKCPEDKSLLDRLRNAGESLLYSLEWNSFGNKFWGDVKQGASRHPLNSIFSLSVGSGVLMGAVALVAPRASIPRHRHLHCYRNILNRYIDRVHCTLFPPHSQFHYTPGRASWVSLIAHHTQQSPGWLSAYKNDLTKNFTCSMQLFWVSDSQRPSPYAGWLTTAIFHLAGSSPGTGRLANSKETCRVTTDTVLEPQSCLANQP